MMDLQTLLVATKRFDGDQLVWPADLRIEARFCGGKDTPPDVFMQRCTKGFLREVLVIGDVDSAYLPNSEVERWARAVCTGSFARSLNLSPLMVCDEVEVLSFYRLPGRVSLRFAESVKHVLHEEWSIEKLNWTMCPSLARRVHEIRGWDAPPEVRATMMMLLFTPVHVAAALCDELVVPYPLRIVLHFEGQDLVVNEHPSMMVAAEQVRLAAMLSDEHARVAIEGWCKS